MTPQEVAGVLRRLHGAFSTEITEEMAQTWINTFSGDEAPLVEQATYEWIRERTYFPSPADLRYTMRGIIRREEPERALETASASAQLITGPEGGFQIAYDAYCQTVRMKDREPKSYEEFVGLIPVEGKR